MKIANKEFSFCDNTKELQSSDIFVKTSLNSKYIDEVKQNKIIDESELIDYFDFSSIKIVGVTGTNGKTTVSGAIYSFLLDLGKSVALLGTRGFFIDDKRIKDKSLTTPTLLELYDDILIAIDRGCEYFIMEVSSHAIAQNRISGIEFALKIHTNITRDHLDFHKSLQNYIDTKNSFFSDDTPKIINKDDKNIKFNYKNSLSYALDSIATYKVEAYISNSDGIDVGFSFANKLYHFSSPLIGVFNIYNLIASISAVHQLTNINLEKICEIIDNFYGISGRMEIVSKKPFIVVDFAHTPDGIKQVCESFKDKNLIVVFGAGGDRDKSKRALMGKIVTQYAKFSIITSDNPRFEDPIKIINDIISNIDVANKYIIELNRATAIKKAISLYKDGDAILVLGKGDEEYQIIYDKKLPFNDKEVILKELDGFNKK